MNMKKNFTFIVITGCVVVAAAWFVLKILYPTFFENDTDYQSTSSLETIPTPVPALFDEDEGYL